MSLQTSVLYVYGKKAPVRPSARKASSGRGSIASANHGLFSDDFRTTKKDKRLIKHSTFMAKVAKTNKKTTKRRRLSKKLVANLDSLADALPDAEQNDPSESNSQIHVIQHKTLRNRPGAMKRKEKMEQLERDRFMKNMSQMNNIEQTAAKVSTAGPSTATESDSTSSRWAALRGFISQTMEHQPAFKNGK
ncbi:ribosome biogenesis protein SLX9-domain-containing protein [Talaromyces proteolyticus]|uniref:Ribosome biogenesis protein SLX9 n=1 Tax=Talaromyces proteolyticus TaxID=1131652 RepID=A0AAD4L2I9_9EURO|nr:ribosome biogenesis protein SLX9-domain-containing protein [Talaromyces proteolyticus]KAH8703374.1 ribosome biogenesis protein SLX9-domain-containing protein [Talaromyces proteolyticus]